MPSLENILLSSILSYGAVLYYDVKVELFGVMKSFRVKVVEQDFSCLYLIYPEGTFHQICQI